LNFVKENVIVSGGLEKKKEEEEASVVERHGALRLSVMRRKQTARGLHRTGE